MGNSCYACGREISKETWTLNAGLCNFCKADLEALKRQGIPEEEAMRYLFIRYGKKDDGCD